MTFRKTKSTPDVTTLQNSEKSKMNQFILNTVSAKIRFFQQRRDQSSIGRLIAMLICLMKDVVSRVATAMPRCWTLQHRGRVAVTQFMLVTLLSFGGNTAIAQTTFILDQPSAITNGLKICDSTDTYCIDIVADGSNAGARIPDASVVGAGGFSDRQDVSTEHTKLDYSIMR